MRKRYCADLSSFGRTDNVQRRDLTSRVAQVNAALSARGEQPRLRRGSGYYYFDGEAMGWPSSSVYVFRADDLDVDRWLEEYDLLKRKGVANG